MFAQVEQELLELWSSVEKEKAAARERSLAQARAAKSQHQTRAAGKVCSARVLLCCRDAFTSVGVQGACGWAFWDVRFHWGGCLREYLVCSRAPPLPAFDWTCV